jgi:type I restriction enzyme S subunit
MKDNWIELIIGNEVNILNGFPFSSSKFNEEGIGTSLIRIRDLLNSSQNTYFDGTFSDNYLVNTGDVLVGMDGDFHLVKWKNSPSLLNQRILKIGKKKNSKIDIDFLFYYLQPFLLDIHSKTAATTVKHLSSYDITNAVKLLPPLTQQRKIAQILTTCDAVIEKTEAAIAKYQAMKQGLMHDLFTRGIEMKTGKLRPKQEDAPQLYKESELGWIPKEWEDTTIGKYTLKSLYGPRFSANDYNENGNVKTIRGTDFSKDGSILYDQAPIALMPNSKIETHILKGGDIVMITTADCGLTAVFEEQDFNFIPSAYSVKFRFNDKIEPYFIKNYMQTNFATRQVNKYVRQGTLGNLPGSDVLNFSIAIPSKIEQIEIVNRIKSLTDKLEIEQTALSKYQQLKKGLMQDLLSGTVEVKV